MNPEFIQLIEKKINLFFQPSLVDLNIKAGHLILNLKPDDLRNLSKTIEEFIFITGQGINQQSDKIKDIILKTLKDANVIVTKDLCEKIISLVAMTITTEKYSNKFSFFLNSIDRHYNGFGIKFDKSKFRIDLLSTKYEATVRNLVRRNIQKIETEIKTLYHASKSKIKNSEFNFTDTNQFIELKPNIFGIGINFNNIILKIQQWYRRKKNT